MPCRHAMAVLASILLLTGCATSPPMDREALTFAPISGTNKEVSVSVTQTLFPGDAGYIPSNENWLQHELTIRSNGRPLTISMVVLVDQSGKLLKPALSGIELSEEPNFTKQTGKHALISTGSMLAQFFIPFAGAIGGATVVADTTTAGDDVLANVKAFKRVSVVGASLDAGGRATGSVFFPPLEKPKALLVTYSVGKQEKRIRIAIR